MKTLNKSSTIKLVYYANRITDVDHEALVEYVCERYKVPWVPSIGSFVRLRDPDAQVESNPGHSDFSGWVDQVVTVDYGTRTVIEVYIDPRELREALVARRKAT